MNGTFRFDLRNAVPGRGFMPRILCVLLLSGLLIQCSQTASGPLKAGDRAPDFSLEALSGGEVELEDLSKKGPVLVNFWATWCAPCKAEIPFLNELTQKYQGKGLSIVGISSQEEKEVVASFVRRFQVQYPVLLDLDADVAKEYGLFAVPTTVLVDREGKVTLFKPGIINEDIIGELDALIGKTN
jgi:peroxiredoxin